MYFIAMTLVVCSALIVVHVFSRYNSIRLLSVVCAVLLVGLYVAIVVLGVPRNYDIQVVRPDLGTLILIVYWFLPFTVAWVISIVLIAQRLLAQATGRPSRTLLVWLSALMLFNIPWLYLNLENANS